MVNAAIATYMVDKRKKRRMHDRGKKAVLK
jgi:hypothetical protein